MRQTRSGGLLAPWIAITSKSPLVLLRLLSVPLLMPVHAGNLNLGTSDNTSIKQSFIEHKFHMREREERQKNQTMFLIHMQPVDSTENLKYVNPEL